MLTPVSAAAFAATLQTARRIEFGSYVLHQGTVRRAIVRAAVRGAQVTVTLQRDPLGEDGPRLNAEAARELRAAGATVRLLSSARTSFHLKAAVCDGVTYLDDRNWARSDLIVRDDAAADAALVRRALRGISGSTAELTTRAGDALRREALFVASAGRAPLAAATESFGPGVLAAALGARARRGLPTSLTVNRRLAERGGEPGVRERAALDRLRAAGVQVRETAAADKYAVTVDGAWLGSANASARPEQVDWGLVTREPAVVSALLRRSKEGLTPE